MFFNSLLIIFSSFVNVCVLNQSCGHWLLSSVLHVWFIVALKLKAKFGLTPSMVDSIEDDMVVTLELSMFASNIIMWCFRWFLLFLTKYQENKAHNMVFLMWDPRFKHLRLISYFIDWKQAIYVVGDYDRQSLSPMLLKCHHDFTLC
jgi:hypothetical protein